jgi:hypothetical protein
VLEDYLATRKFQSPFLRASEAVSPLSALWAFLLGPAYYWRKRAPIEALLFAVALGALLFIDDDWDILGAASDLDLGSVIWLVFALAAPVLLPQCYRRKGWIEVAAKGRAGAGFDAGFPRSNE